MGTPETPDNIISVTGTFKTDNPSEESKPVTKGILKDLVTVAAPAMRADIDANSAEIEKLKALTESGMRKSSLAFSFAVFVMYFFTEVYFAYIQRQLSLPEFLHQIIWIMIVVPWMGTGLSKLINLLSEKYGDKK